MNVDYHEESAVICRDCGDRMTALYETGLAYAVAWVCEQCGSARFVQNPYVVREWP